MKYPPKISIVTPSFNQARFLQQTIRSVIDQQYPNLEYIVMDGGSTDTSIEIIKQYEKHLTYWKSEKDNGQADAIYRGFEMATGEIVAWINSDDYYLPNAFHAVATMFCRHPEAEFIIGGHFTVDENGVVLEKYPSFSQNFESLLVWGQHMPQMSSFWLRKTFLDVGGFDRNLHFAFDYDLMLRLTKRKKPLQCKHYLAVQRGHGSSKSSTIWHTHGLPEVERLQQAHSPKSYSTKQHNAIVTQSKLIYSLNRLRCVEDIITQPTKYLKMIQRCLTYFLKYLAAEIP